MTESANAHPTCDYAGGGCIRPVAPGDRICEWHQGYNEGFRRLAKAVGGLPITVYVDETGQRVAAS